MRRKLKNLALKSIATAALSVGALALAAPAHAGIMLYEHINYGGKTYNAGTGYQKSLGSFNDKTSSLKVSGRNVTATLYEDVNFRGAKSVAFQKGSPDLRTWATNAWPGDTWNDRASSVY